MKIWLMEHAWSIISGPVIGIIVYFVHENMQKGSELVNNLSPLVKRLIAFGLSAILTPLAASLGAQLPVECTQSLTDSTLTACLSALSDASWLTVVIGGAVAMLVHHIIHFNDSHSVSTPIPSTPVDQPK